MLFGVGLAAVVAAVALQAVPVLAEALTTNLAFWAVHRGALCCHPHHDFIVQQALAVCQEQVLQCDLEAAAGFEPAKPKGNPLLGDGFGHFPTPPLREGSGPRSLPSATFSSTWGQHFLIEG